MDENSKLIELLVGEVHSLRGELREMRKEIHDEIVKSNNSMNRLNTKFMVIALTMGVAGGKISAILPFLK